MSKFEFHEKGYKKEENKDKDIQLSSVSIKDPV